MKTKVLSFVTLLFISISCVSQEWGTKEFIEKYNYQPVIGNYKNEDDKKTPDTFAMYPNGKEGIHRLIIEKTKIPRKAYKEKISGKVILKYVVDKEGYVTDIEVVKSVSELLDNAAIEVLKKMERWIPGKVNGKNIRVVYRVPFVFRM